MFVRSFVRRRDASAAAIHPNADTLNERCARARTRTKSRLPRKTMFTAIAPARRGPRKARAYRMRGARDVRHPRRLVLAHGCFTSRAQFLQRRQLIASGDGPSTSTELKARLFPEGSTAAAGRVLSASSVPRPGENTGCNWRRRSAARTLPSRPLNDGSGQRLSRLDCLAVYGRSGGGG